eukprot:gene15105-16847_t
MTDGEGLTLDNNHHNGDNDKRGNGRNHLSELDTVPIVVDTKIEIPQSNVQKWKKSVEEFCEGSFWMAFMGLLTIWTLYQGDIRDAATGKEADLAFEVIISICFFLFSIEIFLQCFYKEGYLILPKWEAENGDGFWTVWEKRLSFGSFYFWMDIVATFTLIFDMDWMLDTATQQALNGGGSQAATAGSAVRVGSRVGRIIRLVRMVRLIRIGKLYKYGTRVMCAPKEVQAQLLKEQEEEEEVEESKVGTAMADLTNRRVIVLILLMLVIIPLLNQNDSDVSLNLAVQLVHNLATLNATNPAVYENGLLLAINLTMTQLPVAGIVFNDNYRYYYDESLIN